MRDRKDQTVPIPEDWEALIEDELGYGDSKAGWIRDAITQRFEAEGIEYEPLEDDTGNRTTPVAAD